MTVCSNSMDGSDVVGRESGAARSSSKHAHVFNTVTSDDTPRFLHTRSQGGSERAVERPPLRR